MEMTPPHLRASGHSGLTAAGASRLASVGDRFMQSAVELVVGDAGGAQRIVERAAAAWSRKPRRRRSPPPRPGGGPPPAPRPRPLQLPPSAVQLAWGLESAEVAPEGTLATGV